MNRPSAKSGQPQPGAGRASTAAIFWRKPQKSHSITSRIRAPWACSSLCQMPLAAHQYTGRYMAAKPASAMNHEAFGVPPGADPALSFSIACGHQLQVGRLQVPIELIRREFEGPSRKVDVVPIDRKSTRLN